MFIPMVDDSLEVQPAVTKTATFEGPALDLGDNYRAGGLGQPVGAVVEVTAIDDGDANETYTFTLQESEDGSTGWSDIGAAVAADAVGLVVAKGLVTVRYVRLVATLGGTTPSITYSAHLGLI